MHHSRTRWLMALAAVAVLGLATSASAQFKLELKDPKGDDNGPGTYTYPTDQVYLPGSFDLLSFSVEEKGDDIVMKVGLNQRIEDPWGSSGWGGNGFSIQHIQIYIDTDHKDGSGFTEALPGIHANFKKDEAWDKCVIIHAQGNTRVRSEVETKAPKMASAVVLPKKVQATGKTLTATISKADLGEPQASWGWQVLVQSNEGFPDPADILTRKVNEYEGQHRFGGGSDYEGDPHFMDMLCGEAKGDASEVDCQHNIMKDYVSDPDPAKNKWVVVPMIYPKP
jgi:carbohydrate-binding DOMON domain-containing protein